MMTSKFCSDYKILWCNFFLVTQRNKMEVNDCTVQWCSDVLKEHEVNSAAFSFHALLQTMCFCSLFVSFYPNPVHPLAQAGQLTHYLMSPHLNWNPWWTRRKPIWNRDLSQEFHSMNIWWMNDERLLMRECYSLVPLLRKKSLPHAFPSNPSRIDFFAPF